MGVFRLVALDLDGTTIDRELVVRPRVREAIGAVAERQGCMCRWLQGAWCVQRGRLQQSLIWQRP